MVGDTSVGKTTILGRYAKGKFFENTTPTVAVEFCGKIVRLYDGTRVKAQIWDTAGQEKYRSLVNQHYRKALGALLVYDVTRKETFASVRKYLYDLKQLSEPDCVVYLIGNKSDLVINNKELRGVPLDEVKQFAAENDLKYVETSAFSDVNVSEGFVNLLEDVNKTKNNSRIKEDNQNTFGAKEIKVVNVDRQRKPKTEEGDCAC